MKDIIKQIIIDLIIAVLLILTYINVGECIAYKRIVQEVTELTIEESLKEDFSNGRKFTH